MSHLRHSKVVVTAKPKSVFIKVYKARLFLSSKTRKFCVMPVSFFKWQCCDDDLILSSPSEQTEETEVYQDLCWQHLSDDFVCSRPLVGKQTTYTECCCLYGEAWGMQCALCPMKESGKETYTSVLGMKSEILNRTLHLYLG